jgi:uncharacterized membrane protein YvbJ
MAKPIKCPQCGAGDADKISENEYECNYCNSKFYIDRPAQQQRNQQQQQQSNTDRQMDRSYDHAKRTSKMMLTVIISVLILIFGFIFYMTNQSMKQHNDAMQDVKKQIEESVANPQ